MQVCYCDLCGSPIKDYKWKLLAFKYIEEPIRCDDYPYYTNNSFIQKKDREICEKCYAIILDLFENRFSNLMQISEDIKALYNLSDKQTKTKTKNE